MLQNIHGQCGADMKVHYNIRKQTGLCVDCGKASRPGLVLCQKCTNKSVEYNKNTRSNRTSAGMCVKCGVNPPIVNKKYCTECRTKENIRQRMDRKRIQDETFAAYGGYKCNCNKCIETNPLFLTIDHIDGGGEKHRAKVVGKRGGGYWFYLWLKRNNFPKGFQVLCFNCNCGRSRNGGICPHEQ